MIRDYYKNKFGEETALFMGNRQAPHFGHSWSYDCSGLDKIPIASRPAFLICLYFTVLVDQAMHAHFRADYQQFEQLTQYPKFCHGLGQFHHNPRAILSVPVQKGMVNKREIEKLLPDGMKLFVDEVVDFLDEHMRNITPSDFFDKLIHDPDIEIPLLVVVADPGMKEDVVVKAHEALRSAVEDALRKKG